MRTIFPLRTIGIASAILFSSLLACAAADELHGYGMRPWGGRGHDQGMMRPGGMQGRFMERFSIVDANDDGRIGDDEAAAQREAVFAAMDADDSGELTEAEYMAVRMGPGDGRDEDRRKAREEAKRARFAPMDTDKSATVSKAEFMTAGRIRFETADADKDGVVTPWEFRAIHE